MIDDLSLRDPLRRQLGKLLHQYDREREVADGESAVLDPLRAEIDLRVIAVGQPVPITTWAPCSRADRT